MSRFFDTRANATLEEITEIKNQIKEIDLVILDLNIKKTTRQPFKPHEFKRAKKERARLITQYWEIYKVQSTSNK